MCMCVCVFTICVSCAFSSFVCFALFQFVRFSFILILLLFFRDLLDL